MTINYRRVGLVALFILIVIGIGFAIYYVFFRNVFGPGGIANGNRNGAVFPTLNGNRNVNAVIGNVNGLPAVNAGGPGQIANGGQTQTIALVPTVEGGAAIAGNGRDLIYYDPTTGLFYQVSPDGRTRTPLSDAAYPNADKITWSPLRDKAIIEFPDDSKYLYDFRKKQQYTLAPEMTDIGFSPGSDQIVFKFIGDAPEDQLLAISNPDGSNVRTLEPLGDKADQFSPNWSPAGNVVGTFSESIDASRQRIIPIGQLGENFASVNLPGRGYEGSWSPAGDKLLFSVFTKESGYNPTLYLTNGRTEEFGGSMVNLDMQTWPSKCAFNASGLALYCAVPQYLEQGSGLFPDSALDIPDDFYRIDLVTGQKILLANPVNQSGINVYSASQLFLSSDEALLYFYDQHSGQIQKIQLK